MTHRKTLRRAFVTVAAAAAIGGGCSTTVKTDDLCTHGDPGCDAPCPQASPIEGTFCQQDGQYCYFGGDDCDELQAHCDAGVWETERVVSSCNPPPPDDPECPDTLPTQGASCESWGSSYVCDGYVDPFCQIPVSATCEGGTWFVDQVACNPPPPELCWDAPDEASCVAVGFCSWHEPACTDPTIATAGCYPAAGCDACWGECIAAAVHPCPDGKCGSCSAETQLCVPPNG